MIRDIVTDDDLLRVESAIFAPNADRQILEDLRDTLLSEVTGVGMAAVQIGEPVRVFVMKVDEEIRYFVNPVVMSFSKKFFLSREGCLSAKGKLGVATRASSVAIKHLDENLKERTSTFKGFLAAVAQHELDHISGKTLRDMSVIDLQDEEKV